ncbi:type IV pilus biogenesis/stability protein PilW [Shewanella sp. WXL01]|uniref:Type IV pilus biogenesis/stability protein PilW n=1 Tax=Shewanella maritima TaxID=2520507 RepID=A0A411PEC5_9GAMM|nr:MULTISPECIES: type IV pilus biogenesis/stability protein PilW [Shewanella]NKF50002.1 type IV pilus biogenesis/stability protein PilW [Shewanella sp. WXL01]QBF81937.1 type IV pilus biogenesis/stability protein PilW [Shewanella maritima]
MKHGLPHLLGVTLLSLTVTGCVTERTYSGTDVPVSERAMDKEAAARERMQLGLTYLQRGNSEQAKFNLDKAVSYAPHLSEVHVALAYYYQTVGDLVRTEDAYEDAINSGNATGDARNNFGVFLCQQEKYERAEKQFLAAINMPKYTRTASSYENLGVCSRKAGDNAKAREYFEMALKYDPRRTASVNDLIELAMEDADYSGAQKYLSYYHKLSGETAESLALGIKIERELNNIEAAKRLGILLIAKFPQSKQAKEYRANMH